ncbi:MAG: prolyl oligopeptidase family serine peptidase [Bacteroidota bacterium]
MNYPETFRDTSVVDDYFGKKISDPYRWLEDDNSSQTKKWVQAENQATDAYLSQIPFRQQLTKRLEQLWNYERFSTPFEEGDRYYYFKNDGLQNQSVLYAQNTLDGPAEEILNPNLFSEDGTSSMGQLAFSRSGRYLAYEISEGGSDWRSIRVRDLQEGKTLADQVDWVKFSGIAWHKDGFFYSRYPEPQEGDELSGKSEFQQVYYHKLGDPQSKDKLIFADRSNPYRGFVASTTEDERFLVLTIWESTSGNALYFRDLDKSENEFIPVIENFHSDFQLIDSEGDNLLILTNYKAPNKRLVSINANKPEENFWENILPESEDVLRSVRILGGKIVATYIHNASSTVRISDMSGKLIRELELPGIGTVGNISGKKEKKSAFYSFSSFTTPSTIYSLDLETFQSKVFKTPAIDFKSEDYVTKQIWYKSYDGTKVPMFVTHKKGLELDGKRPTLLYGYGGFDISILPGFNITGLNLGPIFMENGGVLAIANIRGGGEFGKKWHEAGTREKKQNVFNDFQAAAEHLIEKRYTSSDKLAIYGRSNGGLLVGACMTQRPDLYAVALPAVGVLDMLRYQEFTIGRAWAADYGLSESEKGFDYLLQYSPLHNIGQTKYPATMITTADHDDRVVPAHSFKFAASLQENQQGDNPVVIRIETSAGHGAGKPTSKRIAEAADILAFTFYNLEENVRYLKN